MVASGAHARSLPPRSGRRSDRRSTRFAAPVRGRARRYSGLLWTAARLASWSGRRGEFSSARETRHRARRGAARRCTADNLAAAVGPATSIPVMNRAPGVQVRLAGSRLGRRSRPACAPSARFAPTRVAPRRDASKSLHRVSRPGGDRTGPAADPGGRRGTGRRRPGRGHQRHPVLASPPVTPQPTRSTAAP